MTVSSASLRMMSSFRALLDRPGYCGTHITHAARTEPTTPSGDVWASEA